MNIGNSGFGVVSTSTYNGNSQGGNPNGYQVMQIITAQPQQYTINTIGMAGASEYYYYRSDEETMSLIDGIMRNEMSPQPSARPISTPAHEEEAPCKRRICLDEDSF